MLRTATATVIGLALFPAPAAFGMMWTEIGDAGSWPDDSFQPTVGTGGQLDLIVGSTSSSDGDWVDAYGITVKDPDEFYATTSALVDAAAGASFDTRLWLFDLDGRVLLANDDFPESSSPYHSMVADPAVFGGVFDGKVETTADHIRLEAGGKYVLVISGYANDPEDSYGRDLAGPLFDEFKALHGANPSAGPFARWENTGATGSYTIALNGATFNILPAQGAGPAVLIGLAGIVARRRRRSRHHPS